MDIRQLNYFVNVVEKGSISRAAVFLHIAQPALSRQINGLEVELKQRLLVRNGRGVTPTLAGERLLNHARTILQVFERASEDMENARLGRAGSLAIGMPSSLSAAIATKLISTLHEQLPEAKVHILNGRSTQIQEWILSGRVDMAVLFDAPNSPMLETHELFEEKLHLYEHLPGQVESEIGPDIALSEVAEHPLIITSRPNRVRELLENALSRLGQKLLLDSEIDSLDTTLVLVRAGKGRTVATLRSLRTVGAADHGLRLRKIVEPEIGLKVHIVLRARRLNNRLHDAAFRLLHDLCMNILKP